MRLGTGGLTDVPTAELERLLSAVHRGGFTCPITLPELARHGLQHVAEGLEVLRGLDAAAVKVALIVALSERREAARRAARADASNRP